MFEPLNGEKMQRDYAWAFFNSNGFNLPRPTRLSPKEFALEYANRRNMRAHDFLGGSRVRRFSHARQDCMAAMKRNYPDMSKSAIGRIFQGRDHSTVGYSIEKSDERAKARTQT